MPSRWDGLPNRWGLRTWWPWAVLAVGLTLTVWRWQTLLRSDQAQLEATHTAQLSALADRLGQRIDTLKLVLKGASGYLARDPRPTRSEWRNYVEGLGLFRSSERVQGLSFTPWISRRELPAHIRHMKVEGFPDYTIVSGGALPPDPEGLSAIVFIEPMDERNQRAFGRDMWADPVWREAMSEARDSGNAALSRRLTLYQEGDTGRQSGLVLFAPVYRPHLPLETVTQRRTALLGWVTAVIRMGDFMEPMLSGDSARMGVRVFEGASAEGSALLFDSVPSRRIDSAGPFQQRAFAAVGRTWTLQLQQDPELVLRSASRFRIETLVGGIIITLLTGGMAFLITGSEARARALAEARGEEILATEAQFRALFEKAPFGMAIVDSGSGHFLSANARLGDILGYTPEELLELDVQSLTHPDHRVSDRVSVQDLASGVIREIREEKRYLHRDGHEVWGRRSMVRLPAIPGGPARHLSIVEDITQAHWQELKIRDSEARFRGLFDLSPDPITLSRLSDGALVMANPAWCNLAGIPQEEALGHSPAKLGAWARPWERDSMLTELRRAGRIMPRESILRHRDGTDRQVLITAQVMNFGEEDLVLVMGKDVTDRHQAAQALKESEARWHLALEGAGDGVWDWEAATNTIFMSPRYKTMLGYGPDEEMPSTYADWIDRIHPGDVAAVMGQVDAYLKGEVSLYETEYRIRRKDGTYIWVLARGMGLSRDETGRPTRMIGTHTETTERKQVEAALQDSEYRFRTLVEESPVAIFLHQGGCFSFVNAAALRLFRADRPEDLLGKPVLDRVHPDDLDLVRQRITQGLEQGEPNPISEQRLIALNGTPVDAEVQARLVTYLGGKALLVFAQDIGARKRAMEDLKRSEADLARAQEIGRFGSWKVVFSEGGEAWTCSEGLRQLYGYVPGQPITLQTGFDAMHPEDRAFAQSAWQSALLGRGPCDWEHRILVEGRVKWLAIRVQLEWAGDGRLSEASGIVQDITERKLAEEALRLSEARLRILGDQLPDSFLYQFTGQPGERLRFIYLSAGIERLCGLKAEAVLRDSGLLLAQIDPAMLPAYREAEAACGKGLAPFAMDLRQRRADGEWRWFRVRSMPRELPDGTVLWEGIATDITDQKAVQIQLQENEDRFRGVVENAGDAIYLNDAEGRIFLCNRAACASTGYSMEELLRLRIMDLDSEFTAARNVRTVRHLRPDETATILARHRRKDGSTFPVEVRISLLREEEPRQILAVVRDLTEREQMQKADLRAQKAESLVLMAGGIAHDFNNLFQGVLGHLEVAAFKAEKQPAIAYSIGQAEIVLRKAIGLSWKMLDFSGRGLMRMERVDLETWLPALLATVDQNLPATFTLDLRCEPVPYIKTDCSKLEQVLKAVLDNALEAAGAGGGAVRVRLHVDFGEDRSGPGSPGVWPLARPEVPATVCLEVADDGPGVPAENLSLICDPFYTTRALGRGLGLAAAVGILNAHRAGLHLLNGPEKGLILRMHFPPGGA